MKAKPFKKSFVKYVKEKVGAIQDFLDEDEDNEMGFELEEEFEWFNEVLTKVKDKSLPLASDTLNGLKAEVETALDNDWYPDDFWNDFEDIVLKDVVSAWESVIPSRWGNQDYRRKDCGLIKENWEKDRLQLVVYVSSDAYDSLTEGLDFENPCVQLNKNEFVQVLSEAFAKEFVMDFRVSMDEVCYGDDVVVSIDYEDLLNETPKALEKLKNTDDIENMIWEYLAGCVSITEGMEEEV